MTAPPLVSVVMPARNAAAHIGASIQSIRTQSLEDWELLVVDDASTDDTRPMVERMSRGDSRVGLIGLNSRVGVSAARNISFDDARGRYVLFLDSDDWLLDDALATLIRAAEGSPCNAAAGGFRVVGMRDEILHHHLQQSDSIGLDDLIDRAHLVTGCHLLERCWFEDHRFDESLDAYEDLDLWLRLAGAGVDWACVPDEVCAYRTHPNGLSSRSLVMGRACCEALSRAFLASRRSHWPVRLNDESSSRETLVRRSRMLTYATRSVIVDGPVAHEEAAGALTRELKSEKIHVDEAIRAARFGFIFGLGISPEEALASFADRIAALEAWWSMLGRLGLAAPSLSSCAQADLHQSHRYASAG